MKGNTSGDLSRGTLVAFWKGVAAFVGINLVVAVPLAFLVALCMPQEIELEVIKEGNAAVAVSYGRHEDGTVDFCLSSELYEQKTGDAGSHLYKGHFPRVFDLSAPAFFIRIDPDSKLAVRNLRMVVGPFCRMLSPNAIAAAYRVDGASLPNVASNGSLELIPRGGSCHLVPLQAPAWSQWEFSDLRKYGCVPAVVLGVEFSLIFFALGLAYVRRHAQAGRLQLGQSLSLALTVVFFYFYVVPLQSYFSNAFVFPFGFGDVLREVLPYSAVAFMVFGCGLVLTEFLLGRVVHFALLAFLVYEYLEVGLFLRGAPSFTGDMKYYEDLNIIAIDWLVFVYAFVFIAMPYSRLKKYFAIMLSSFSVMLVAAVFDSWANGFHDDEKPNSTKWDCPRTIIPQEVGYSTNRNVIVFVLDSVTSEVANDVVRESPEEQRVFDGFVAFNLNVGMQSRSELATVGLFTGEFFCSNYYNKDNVSQFTRRLTKRGSVLFEYLESSHYVYCMLPPPEFNSCYVSPPRVECGTDSCKARSTISCPLLWCPPGNPTSSMSVLTLSFFKVVPFGIKSSVFHWLCPNAGFAEEDYIYPCFRSAPVNRNSDVFLYCHTHGVHVPHDVSSDGVRRGIVSPSYWACRSHAKLVFAELAKTLESYKIKGVYDSSTILVIADHGAHVPQDAKSYDSRKDALPPVAFPMLWVKPANSRGQIVFDETTPTTHANLHKVLRALKDRDLTTEEIAEMLRSDLRVFIRQIGDGYDQWEVLPDMSVKSFQHIKVP